MHRNPIETSGARCDTPKRMQRRRIEALKDEKFKCKGKHPPLLVVLVFITFLIIHSLYHQLIVALIFITAFNVQNYLNIKQNFKYFVNILILIFDKYSF